MGRWGEGERGKGVKNGGRREEGKEERRMRERERDEGCNHEKVSPHACMATNTHYRIWN